MSPVVVVLDHLVTPLHCCGKPHRATSPPDESGGLPLPSTVGMHRFSLSKKKKKKKKTTT
eukprot:NODE_14462_length_1108_cov_2.659531.p9 GENE.NODE_14462_length_1108_cov_2.659531~~NODE_14462_length_1108_cov_2.659531.p9  ORF type:complete len:60 (-),score=25.20 NODE_14462_length_1108_cov_2.659531:139-318(-)